jgi:predicted acylesterase/phospholipase RssA
VLVGWSETGRRPEFDVVTGVSTGSFMAALVFAGPKYDAVLKKIYTTYSNSDIYEDKGAAGLVTESLLDDAPLRRLIERIVTRSFVVELAAQHAKGRRLYVATTNLDSGELVVWDLGAIAAGDRADPVLMVQKVLRASAAVPGFFAPVYIKPQKGVEVRQAHVDGGVKAPVLIKSFMFDQPARERNLYVIVNGSLARLNAGQPVKASVTDIGRKSITELLRSLTDASLYQAYAAARNSGSNFRLLAIPDDVQPSLNALDFNKPTMQRLYTAGRALALKPDPWSREPPRLEAYEKIAAPAGGGAAGAAVQAPAAKAAKATAAKVPATDLRQVVESGP